MQIRELILEDFKKQDLVDAIKDFLPIAMAELKLTSLPKIVPLKHVPDKKQPTFGKYVSGKQIIYLGIQDRHIIDILRTLAHELVHYKQDLDGRLDSHSGETGSPIENEAHEIAGVIMRHFNKTHRDYFNISAVTLDEALSRRDMLTGLVGLAGGVGATGLSRMLSTPPRPPEQPKPNPIPPPAPEPEPPEEKIPKKQYFANKAQHNEYILKTVAEEHGITGVELIQLLSQASHETGNFVHLTELGNSEYFKRYEPFYALDPKTPERLGNNKEGDGERYKGRGFLHITGRYNYREAGKAIKQPLEEKPELVANDLQIAALVTIWFWKKFVRPRIHDFHDVKRVTRIISPKMFGLDERKKEFENRLAQYYEKDSRS